MKILITGGRNYADRQRLFDELDFVAWVYQCTKLIHGGASGADRLASEWAKLRGVPVVACPADWRRHGRAAGPIRNREMLAMGVGLVVAFSGGKGTADCVKAAKEMSIEVREVCDSGCFR